MNFLWRHNVAGAGFGDASGHKALGFPVFANEGDNRDWIFATQRLLHPETGAIVWSAPDPIPSRNPHTTHTGLASERRPSGHTDSIQIGDFRGDGELYVMFGVDGMISGQLFHAQTGRFVWTFDHATELQYLNMGNFRTDAEGMFVYGLERRNRGAWPMGHHGTFMIDHRGQPVFVSENYYQAWTASAYISNNAFGSFSPLGLNHNRNIEAILSGNPTAVLPENMLPSTLVDGYMNTLVTIPEISTISTTRAMVADFVGDSRDEIVLYNEFGDIKIVAIGSQEQCIRSGITDTPRTQTRNLGNWTRYNVMEVVTYFGHRTAPSPKVDLLGVNAEITLIPIIFAERYDLYHNGEHIKTFDPLIDDLRFSVSDLPPGDHEFTFTASRFDHIRDSVGTTLQSMPATVTISAVFDGTNPARLRDLLVDYDVVLRTRSNLGIFAQHSPFVVPEGRTLTIETTLNVQRDANLIVEGTLIVAEGGRLNNQGNGSRITIASGGRLINHGHVENVSRSIISNCGEIINMRRFEVRAETQFSLDECGTIENSGQLNIHRDAVRQTLCDC